MTALAALLLLAVTGDGRDPGPKSVPAGPRAAWLQAELNGAIASGAPRFVLPAADYYFNDDPLVVSNASDMQLVAEGDITLWFRVGAGVRIEHCANITVHGAGLQVDYDPPPFMQATALTDAEVDVNSSAARGGSGSGVTFTVPIATDPGFLDPIQFWNTYSNDPATEFVQGPQWWQGDRGNNYPLFFSAFRDFNATTQVSRTANGTLVYRGVVGTGGYPSRVPRRGDKVTAVIRKGFTWLLHNCSAVTTRDVNIHTASFMAVTEFDGPGGNAYHNVNVVRRPAATRTARCGKNGGRLCLALVASNADVFHSSGCQRGPLVQGCEFSYAMDDYCNVHSRVQVAAPLPHSLGRADAATILAIDPRLAADSGLQDDLPYGTVETLTNVRPGMTLSFRDPATLELLHRGTVAALRRVSPGDPLATHAQAVLDALPGTAGVVPAFHATSVTGAGVSEPRVWRLQLRQSFSPRGPVLLEADQWANNGAVFRDNHLHHAIDGVRWKSSGGSIVNNTWQMAPPVALTGLEVTPLRSFFEGPLTIADVVVAGNDFAGVPGSAQAGFITQCQGMSHAARPRFTTCTNITVTGNRFTSLPTLLSPGW